jgi:hypothetical protein
MKWTVHVDRSRKSEMYITLQPDYLKEEVYLLDQVLNDSITLK